MEGLNSMEVVNEEEREITELITEQAREIRQISHQILHGHETSMQHEHFALQHDALTEHKIPLQQMASNGHQAHGQYARNMALINQISQVHKGAGRNYSMIFGTS